VAGCSYKVSAELAYYLPDRVRTVSAEIAGDNGLQYGYWLDPRTLAGHDGIVVLDERERDACRRLADACSELVPLAPVTVWRGFWSGSDFRELGLEACARTPRAVTAPRLHEPPPRGLSRCFQAPRPLRLN
jgi:hypothetical protein